jgi:hypothetical protein
MAKKAARKAAPGRPFKRGDDPRRNTTTPGPGRPPNEHIEWCRRLVSDPASEAAVEAVLRDKSHPAFATMWRAVSERAYGKPAQPLTGPDGGAIPVEVTVTRRIVRA